MANLTTNQQTVKELLDNFVNNGGNVNDLSPKDELYQKIKNMTFNNLSLEEKFSALEHPRKAKVAPKNTTKERLIAQINEWLNSGHNFEEILQNKTSVKTLPFYELLSTYRRNPKNKHLKTFGDVIKSLGFTYPETYYRYLKINELNKFKDTDGYVDSYRKDSVINNYIDNCAQNLEMPVYAVVCIVGNFKLKKMAVHGDLVKVTQNELLQYYKENGSLTNLKYKAPATYEKLVSLSKFLIQDSGTKLTTADVLDLLEIPREGTRYGNTSNKEPLNEEEINNSVMKVAKENNGKVTPDLLGSKLYSNVVKLSCQKGIPVLTYMESLGLSYRGAINHERLSKYYVSNHPTLDRAIELRDKLLIQKQSIINSLPKELAFEIYLDCCKMAYNEALAESEQAEDQEK